jgi:hypothetical protein
VKAVKEAADAAAAKEADAKASMAVAVAEQFATALDASRQEDARAAEKKRLAEEERLAEERFARPCSVQRLGEGGDEASRKGMERRERHELGPAKVECPEACVDLRYLRREQGDRAHKAADTGHGPGGGVAARRASQGS